MASCDGSPDVVRLLLEQGADLEAQLDDHSTPLFVAAEHGKLLLCDCFSIVGQIFKHVAKIFGHFYTLHHGVGVPTLWSSY